MNKKRTLCFIGAHPDDEASGVGSTLAYYAAAGVKVYYVCATRGEAGMNNLNLAGNQISEILPLRYLTNLENLDLGENQISDIAVLAFLSNLNELYLYGNEIEDIGPLLANNGLSDGDTVGLSRDFLSQTSLYIYIPNLEQQGVEFPLED